MISGKADGVYGVSILATLTLAILNQVADEEMDIVDLESVDLIYYRARSGLKLYEIDAFISKA